MLVFPQLTTGTVAVYPVTKELTARTVANRLADGRRVVYSDPDWDETRWELRATGLNEIEWNAIDALWEAASGRLESFTFLDPVGNLLKRSEEFDQPEWNNGPLISLTNGPLDPLGTSRATNAVNGGGSAADVAQLIDVPGDFHYVLSVWARGSGNGVSLAASTTGGSAERILTLSSNWVRFSMTVELGQATDQVTFGVRLAAGATVDLFGMQVEAQLAASPYQKTGARSGVHSAARFSEDALAVRARGTDVFDAVIRIVSKGN